MCNIVRSVILISVAYTLKVVSKKKKSFCKIVSVCKIVSAAIVSVADVGWPNKELWYVRND